MSKIDWSKLLEKCHKCNCEFEMDNLITYNKKSYCKECFDEIQNEKLSCYKCNNIFIKNNLIKKYGNLYCKKCLKEEQDYRKKEKFEKKHLDQSQSINTDIMISTAQDRFNQSQINDMKEELLFLKGLLLQNTSQVKPFANNEKDFINLILLEFAGYDFDILIEDIMQKYDLKQYDNGLGINNTFYTMSNIKKIKDIIQSPDKYKASRFINRIKRGDGSMYKVVFNLMKNKIIDIIRKEKSIKN